MTRLVKALNFVSKTIFTERNAFFPFPITLQALNSCLHARSKPLKESLATLILSEVNPDGSYNYWLKNSHKRVSEKYPNDLDDTFYAWLSLANYKPSLIDVATLSKLGKILSKTKDPNSNIYATWIVSSKQRARWLDYDLGVNSTVARFLKTHEIPNDDLFNHIKKRILENNFSSFFYHHELVLCYFLSDLYKHHYESDFFKKKLQSFPRNLLEGGNLLLWVISVLNMKYYGLLDDVILNKALALQHSNGGVFGFPLYYYQDVVNKSLYYQNDSLSTALFIELLGLIDEYRNQSLLQVWKNDARQDMTTACHSLQRDDVREYFLEQFGKLLASKDVEFSLFLPHQVSLSFFSLSGLDDFKITLRKLVLFQVFAWIGYKIYDDFHDSDLKNPQHISFANISLQLLFKTIIAVEINNKSIFYQKLFYFLEVLENNFLQEKQFLTFSIDSWFDGEQITERELLKLTYQKSSGQIFTTMVSCANFTNTDMNKLHSFIKNIILLKQLFDDVRDLFTDLSKRKITMVSYYLLESMRNLKTRKLLLRNSHDLRLYFFTFIFPKIQVIIYNRIQQAKSFLETFDTPVQAYFFRKILSRYEKILEENMRDRNILLRMHNLHENFVISQKPDKKTTLSAPVPF